MGRCKECKYWLFEEIDKGHNNASYNCTNWTEKNDSCEEFTPKEKK